MTHKALSTMLHTIANPDALLASLSPRPNEPAPRRIGDILCGPCHRARGYSGLPTGASPGIEAYTTSRVFQISCDGEINGHRHGGVDVDREGEPVAKKPFDHTFGGSYRLEHLSD